MAATRPLTLVYQEFATLNTTPETPTLNCLIAGPSYWIKDYPEDKDDILLSTSYGTAYAANSYTAPADADHITVTTLPGNKAGAVLDTTSVKFILDNVSAEIAKYSSGGLPSTATTTANSPDMTIGSGSFVSAGVKVGDIAVLTDIAGSPATITRTVRTVEALKVTFTSEITTTGFTPSSSIKYRFERIVPAVTVDSSFVITTSGSNIVVLKGGIVVDVDGISKTINSASIYLAYRSLRTDLQVLHSATSNTNLTSVLGKYDSRNPLRVGVSVALKNTNTPIQYFGIASDDSTGYDALRGYLSTRKDVYAVVPLTTSTSVLASFKTDFESYADPEYAVTNGVPQKFRVVIGSCGTLPIEKTVSATSSTGKSTTATTNLSTFNTLHIPGATLITSNVVPGSIITISADNATTPRNGAYIVTQVLSETNCEVTPSLGAAQSGNLTAVVRASNNTTVLLASATYTAVTNIVDATACINFSDATATFIDSGVIPGDILEIPKASSFDDVYRYEIDTVVSNQRVYVKNNGKNTAIIVNELPHGATRSSPVSALTNSSPITYKIVRTLDKDGQVTDLSAVVTSLASKRVVNVWPDSADVVDLVDGSKNRLSSGAFALASTQPGFYLACAVGGMTAGLPSHQGFTNLGISGVTEIYHSNTYFNNLQLSTLSNSGWFVFFQDTAQSLPYVVHQLTTDVSTLEFGEFSMVKNFDYVSMFYSDILDDFIGKWTLNKETMGFINAAMQSGTTNLKLKKRVRIGAPILSGTVTSLEISTTDESRLEIYLEVDFPKPLNTVALHIVSI